MKLSVHILSLALLALDGVKADFNGVDQHVEIPDKAQCTAQREIDMNGEVRVRSLRRNLDLAGTINGPAPGSQAIISNGVIKLGFNQDGSLNVPSHENEDTMNNNGSIDVGLRFFKQSNQNQVLGGQLGQNPVEDLSLEDLSSFRYSGQIEPQGEWVESTAWGCTCEGWGVSAQIVGGNSFSGYANSAGGSTERANLDPEPIQVGLHPDGETALIDVKVTTGPLRVTHYFHPIPQTRNLYVADVTYENTSPQSGQDSKTLTNLRYRRVMDWDIPPTIYDECVSIDKGNSIDFEYASDNGFARTDPLSGANDIMFSCAANGGTCPVWDSGPHDHGALFQFLFKNANGSLRTLGPQETFTFQIVYGAAGNKIDAFAALQAFGVEVRTNNVNFQYSALTTTTKSSNCSIFRPCRSSPLGFQILGIAVKITQEIPTLLSMASRTLVALPSPAFPEARLLDHLMIHHLSMNHPVRNQHRRPAQ
jgi:hypothetical protein